MAAAGAAGIPLPLARRDSPLSARLHDLLGAARRERCAFMRLRLARKGSPEEAAFLGRLVEDKGMAGMSYVEFLCQLHRLIQNKGS